MAERNEIPQESQKSHLKRNIALGAASLAAGAAAGELLRRKLAKKGQDRREGYQPDGLNQSTFDRGFKGQRAGRNSALEVPEAEVEAGLGGSGSGDSGNEPDFEELLGRESEIEVPIIDSAAFASSVFAKPKFDKLEAGKFADAIFADGIIRDRKGNGKAKPFVKHFLVGGARNAYDLRYANVLPAKGMRIPPFPRVNILKWEERPQVVSPLRIGSDAQYRSILAYLEGKENVDFGTSEAEIAGRASEYLERDIERFTQKVKLEVDRRVRALGLERKWGFQSPFREDELSLDDFEEEARKVVMQGFDLSSLFNRIDRSDNAFRSANDFELKARDLNKVVEVDDLGAKAEYERLAEKSKKRAEEFIGDLVNRHVRANGIEAIDELFEKAGLPDIGLYATGEFSKVAFGDISQEEYARGVAQAVERINGLLDPDINISEPQMVREIVRALENVQLDEKDPLGMVYDKFFVSDDEEDVSANSGAAAATRGRRSRNLLKSNKARAFLAGVALGGAAAGAVWAGNEYLTDNDNGSHQLIVPTPVSKPVETVISGTAAMPIRTTTSVPTATSTSKATETGSRSASVSQTPEVKGQGIRSELAGALQMDKVGSFNILSFDNQGDGIYARVADPYLKEITVEVDREVEAESKASQQSGAAPIIEVTRKNDKFYYNFKGDEGVSRPLNLAAGEKVLMFAVFNPDDENLPFWKSALDHVNSKNYTSLGTGLMGVSGALMSLAFYWEGRKKKRA